MNIVIVGQGAMGLLWYHHLQQLMVKNTKYKTKSNTKYHNSQLHLLPSNRYLAAKHSTLNSLNACCDQYSFTSIEGLEHISPINFAQISNIQAADVVIFCLKAFQTPSALKSISEHLKSNASIIFAHNGMGTLSELSTKVIKHHNIYALLTTHGCLRTAPLTITHTGIGKTDLGLLSGNIDLPQQAFISQILNEALASVVFHENIKQKQWTKLAINCVINPITAFYNVHNGQVNKTEYSKLIPTLLAEVVSVANKEGVKLELISLKEIVKNVAQATAKNSSSMRCDILANRRSEIDYINGYIHHLGIKHAITTPENTNMWHAVKNLEARF